MPAPPRPVHGTCRAVPGTDWHVPCTGLTFQVPALRCVARRRAGSGLPTPRSAPCPSQARAGSLLRNRRRVLHLDRVRHPHRRRAVGEAPLQRVPDPAVRQFVQPRLAHCRPRGVAAQRLQAVAVARRNPRVGVQREAVRFRAQRDLGLRLPATSAADATIAPARPVSHPRQRADLADAPRFVTWRRGRAASRRTLRP